MSVILSSLSLEYVSVPIKATVNGANYVPTSDTVQMAFPAAGVDPAGGDWQSASWETAATTYYARCLVGPGGTVTLTAGDYDIWVKVTDSPEIPARKTDRLTIE